MIRIISAQPLRGASKGFVLVDTDFPREKHPEKFERVPHTAHYNSYYDATVAANVIRNKRAKGEPR